MGMTGDPGAGIEGHLVTLDGVEHALSPAELKRLRDGSTPFWLDLFSPDPETRGKLLRESFGFHPLAVEDSEHFGERPKIDRYEGFTLFVVFGASHDASPVEVHCYYTARFLVTVHRDRFPELDALAEGIKRYPTVQPDQVMQLHLVLDRLVDSFFPVLAQLDDQIDELEDDILRKPSEEQLSRLFHLKRSLIALRKVITPQRDMMGTLLSRRDLLPEMSAEAEPYFRDLFDHLIRVSELVDSYRDLLSGALDTHLSTVSNRLNVVMKQLTIIATIFLPMNFLVGFFGQNFAWMVNRLTSFPVFLVVGIGLQVITVGTVLLLFRRRGWLAADAVGEEGSARRPGGVHQPTAAKRRSGAGGSSHEPAERGPRGARR